MISIICQSHTCRRPVLISPIITHAAIKLLAHTLMQMLSALICISDLQTAIILQPPRRILIQHKIHKNGGKTDLFPSSPALCVLLIDSRNPWNLLPTIALGQRRARRIELSYSQISTLCSINLFFPPLCPPSFCFLRIFPATCLELLKIVQSCETLPGFCPSATAWRWFLFFWSCLLNSPQPQCGHGQTQIYHVL